MLPPKLHIYFSIHCIVAQSKRFDLSINILCFSQVCLDLSVG